MKINKILIYTLVLNINLANSCEINNEKFLFNYNYNQGILNFNIQRKDNEKFFYYYNNNRFPYYLNLKTDNGNNFNLYSKYDSQAKYDFKIKNNINLYEFREFFLNTYFSSNTLIRLNDYKSINVLINVPLDKNNNICLFYEINNLKIIEDHNELFNFRNIFNKVYYE